MQMVGGNGGNQFRQYAGQNAGNLNGYNTVQNVRNQVKDIKENDKIRAKTEQNQEQMGSMEKSNPRWDNDPGKLRCCSGVTTLEMASGFFPVAIASPATRLHLLHMDLCGPMRIASINGKRYVLVIVEDYSRYTWVHFLRSKDEAPEVIITFLKRITVLLQSPVIIIRTDNDTEFKNQMLKEYFDTVGIFHQMSSVRTPQQNGVAIATVCFTQNRFIMNRRFNKTPHELINGRKPDISFLPVFGALCYPRNDREDIGKLGAK
nr:integrase, catalytic region, zinc finger, CCHC-type, peptidase aspartic, catalytic [Tanacetum cinerariifolium]